MSFKQLFPSDLDANANPPLSATIELSPLNGAFLVKGQKRGKKGAANFMQKSFKNIELKKYSDKWYVSYYFKVPIELSEEYNYKTWLRFRVYEGINYYKGEEKEAFAKELLSNVKEQLQLGFNPFWVEQTKKDVELKEVKLIKEQKPRLTDAMSNFLMQKIDKNRSKETISSYKSFISNIENYLINSQTADIRVDELTNEFIFELLKTIEKTNNLGPTTYNNYLNFIITLINWFAEKPRYWLNKQSFDFGKDTDLENKTSKSERHQFYANNVFQKVKDKIKDYPNLDYYIRFIYYSCMRPDEVRNLKIENIYLNERIIKINGKTGERVVPICDELYALISERINTRLNYYLIGKDGIANQYQHSENYFSRIFRRDIRPDLGLSDKYTIYGFKHTRVIHLIKAGFKDAEVMQLTGHRDTASYDIYKRELGANLNSKLIGETLSF